MPLFTRAVLSLLLSASTPSFAGPNAGAKVYLDGNVGNQQNDRQSSITPLMNGQKVLGVEIFIHPFTGTTKGGTVFFAPGFEEWSATDPVVDGLLLISASIAADNTLVVDDDKISLIPMPSLGWPALLPPPMPSRGAPLNEDGYFVTATFYKRWSTTNSIVVDSLVLHSYVSGDGEYYIDNVWASDTLFAAAPLTINPSMTSLKLDLSPASGNQDLKTKDVGFDDTVTLQLFAESFPAVTGYGFTAIVSGGGIHPKRNSFEVGDFIPGAQALSRGLEIGVASLTGMSGRGDGFLGQLSFRVTDTFADSAEIIVTQFGFNYADGTFKSVPIRVGAKLRGGVRGPSGGLADFNRDGAVNFADFLLFAGAFGTVNPRFDQTGDDFVGFEDFLLFAQAFGT